jgi:hypothetical protein
MTGCYPDAQRYNTLLRRPSVAKLAGSGPVGAQGKKRLTAFYIGRSCDVFGVEFLDFQLVHETNLDAEPFAPLQFEKKDVRLQCERELKAMLVRLRQGYLAALGDKKMVRDTVIFSYSRRLTWRMSPPHYSLHDQRSR